MGEGITRFVNIILPVGYVGAWWFSFWFPFRNRRIALFLAIPPALFASFYVSIFISDVLRGGPEFGAALPFAIAGITFIAYRKRDEQASEQSPPGDRDNAPPEG